MSPETPAMTDAELADAQTIRDLLLVMADTEHRDRSDFYGEQCSCGGNDRPCPDEATVRNAASFMGELLAEVDRLREQLAEQARLAAVYSAQSKMASDLLAEIGETREEWRFWDGKGCFTVSRKPLSTADVQHLKKQTGRPVEHRIAGQWREVPDG